MIGPLHGARTGSVGVTTTHQVDLPEPLLLDCGRALSGVAIAFEAYGRLSSRRDNAVLICHALSGDAHAAGWSDRDDAPAAVDGIGAEERGIRPGSGLGWWDNLIGPGKAFDTDRYYVLCTNLLGSCRGSTGPSSVDPATGGRYGPDFPVITVADMVRAQRAALDGLGIERLLAVAGGSLGGMQALEWSIRFAASVDACITTASTGRLGAQGIAWNAIARDAIVADPEWRAGRYLDLGTAPHAGIGVARMLGHVTYLSAQAMEEKFGRRFQEGEVPSYSLRRADFAVESYLRHQAENFSRRFDANSYLILSRALTYFDLARDHGSLSAAFSRARARYLLLSFTSDWLYPPRDSDELLTALHAAGRDAAHHTIDTTYGHDSFLLEDDRQARLIGAFLDETLDRVRARGVTGRARRRHQ